MCENHKDDQALMIEIGAVTAQLLTLQNENENSRKGISQKKSNHAMMSTLLAQASCLVEIAQQNFQHTRASIIADPSVSQKLARKLRKQQRILKEANIMHQYAESQTIIMIHQIENTM